MYFNVDNGQIREGFINLNINLIGESGIGMNSNDVYLYFKYLS